MLSPVFVPFLTVKVIDLFHLRFRQLKIEDIIVFRDMIRIGRTGNGDVSILYLPAQDDLSRSFTVCCSDTYTWVLKKKNVA